MFLGNPAALNLIHQLLQKKKLPHLLISGPSGHGKNTLAYYAAKEAKKRLIEVNAQSIEDHNDVFALLKENNSIVFLDEVHGLSRKLQESLYPILDGHEFYNRITGRGSQQIITQERIPSISMIFATTRADKINEALKRRTFHIELHPYSPRELLDMARYFSFYTDERILSKLVEYSRGTPGRLRQLAELIRDEMNPYETLCSFIKNMELYPFGLTRTEVQLLKELREPQSLKTISFKLGLAEEVILEEHEPYLRRLGFIDTCQQGRFLTDRGRSYITSSAPGP